MADFRRDPALTLTPFPGPEFDSNEPQLSECCRKLAEHNRKPTFLYLYLLEIWKKYDFLKNISINLKNVLVCVYTKQLRLKFM